MKEIEFTGEPLAPHDPEVLAFRAIQGADTAAVPGSLRHYEVALRGVAEIAPTPLEAREAAKTILEHEKIARLEREYPVIVNLLERSRSITPEEATALRDGSADDRLIDRVHRAIHLLELRQSLKARKASH